MPRATNNLKQYYVSFLLYAVLWAAMSNDKGVCAKCILFSMSM